MKLEKEYKNVIINLNNGIAKNTATQLNKLIAYTGMMIGKLIFDSFVKGGKWNFSKFILYSPFFIYKAVGVLGKITKMWILYFTNRTEFTKEIQKANQTFIF